MLDQEFMLELAGDGGCAANAVARPLHGLAHGLRMPPGDGSNFAEGKALDTIKEKSFAVSAVGAAECGLHQGDHFVRVRSLFRSGYAAIGDGAFARPALIGLMELQRGFVGRFYILPAATVLQMHWDLRLQFMKTRRHLVHGLQR